MHDFVSTLYYFRFLILIGLLMSGCGQAESQQQADVIMVTEIGEVHLQLYDATPIHKANFLKLASSGFYDGMAFHRVIYEFMAQAGDPRTKDAYPIQDADAPDGPGYTLPAEIVDTLIHTPGKIGAARWEDIRNPERRSSGSQFYIITGAPVESAKLDSNEVMYSGVKRGEMFGEYQTALDSSLFTGSFDDFLRKQEFKDFRYTQAHRNQYYEKGGAPWLDFQYTIFGQVIKGMEIIEKIEVTPCDEYDRPKKAIRILQMKVVMG